MKLGTKLLIGVMSAGATMVALEEYARRNPIQVENLKEKVRENGGKVKEKVDGIAGLVKEKTAPTTTKIGNYLQEKKEIYQSQKKEMKEKMVDDENADEIEEIKEILQFIEENKDAIKDAKVVVIKEVLDEDDTDEQKIEQNDVNYQEYNGKVKLPFTMKQWSEMDEDVKKKIFVEVNKILHKA